MKLSQLMLLTLISGQTLATDLIFKSGFESAGLVSGTVSGLSNSGMIIELSSNGQTETIELLENGGFVFKQYIAQGETWSTTLLSLPNNPSQQSCIAVNSSGVMPLGGSDELQVICNNTAWKWDQMSWDEGGWN